MTIIAKRDTDERLIRVVFITHNLFFYSVQLQNSHLIATNIHSIKNLRYNYCDKRSNYCDKRGGREVHPSLKLRRDKMEDKRRSGGWITRST